MYVNIQSYSKQYNISDKTVIGHIKNKKIKSAIKKGKCYFIDNEENYKDNDSFIVKEFPYLTMQEYAEKYNLTKAQVNYMYKQGILKNVDIGNIILFNADTPKHSLTLNNSKSCLDHLGNEYKSISEMCKHYGINYNNYNNKYQRNKNKFKTEKELIQYCLTPQKKGKKDKI